MGQAAAVFDRDKLLWLSQRLDQGAAAGAPGRAPGAVPRARGATGARRRRAWLARVVVTLRERAQTLVEMVEQATLLLRVSGGVRSAAIAKFWSPEAPARYAALIKRLEAPQAFDPRSLEALYRGLAAEMGLKLVDLAQLTRIALTGRTASPPIFEVVALVGRDETLGRLRSAHAAAAAAGETAPPRAARPVGVECRAALSGRPGRGAVRAGPSGRRTPWRARFGRRRVAAVYSSPLRARAPHRGDAPPCGPPCGTWTSCASSRWATGKAARSRRSRRLPGNPYTRWVRDPVASLPPGGEPLADVQVRVVGAIADIERAHPER